MFSGLFCSFREIFCGFRMSTDFLFSLKWQQSEAGAVARRWVCLGLCLSTPPWYLSYTFILYTCGAEQNGAEASLLRASRRCKMARVGEGPRQASSIMVASPQQGWDLCQEAGRSQVSRGGDVHDLSLLCGVGRWLGRPHCPGCVLWVANPGACVDGEGLPELLERCWMRGSPLPSPPPIAVPPMSRGVLTTRLLWMCTCVSSCKGSVLHISLLVSSANHGMEHQNCPVCSKSFASSWKRSDPLGPIPCFCSPLFFGVGGKREEILVSQRGQGVRLLPGGWAESGLPAPVSGAITSSHSSHSSCFLFLLRL